MRNKFYCSDCGKELKEGDEILFLICLNKFKGFYCIKCGGKPINYTNNDTGFFIKL